jgi:iron complex transport system substrate-binding protein
MSRTSLANAAALAAALAAAALAPRGSTRIHPAPVVPTLAGAHRSPVTLPGGGLALADATGTLVPLRPYRRIVSTSVLSDRLLVELAEADRVLAFSAVGARTSLWAYQYAGKTTVEGLGALEPIIALRPDLVLLSSFGAPARVAKLRAAGIAAFDLGEMRGLSTLPATAEAVGALLGHPERAARFLQSFQRRLRAVAAGLGDRRRHTAIYVAAIGPAIYGGTVGTSYHDVLVAAGLVDAAATRFRDWPSYSAEQVIALDPQHLVTKTGRGGALCHHPGLDRLAACRTPGGVIELPDALLDEPGPAMLDAAEALYETVYGQEGAP